MVTIRPALRSTRACCDVAAALRAKARRLVEQDAPCRIGDQHGAVRQASFGDISRSASLSTSSVAQQKGKAEVVCGRLHRHPILR